MLQLSLLTDILSNIAVNRCMLASIEAETIANTENALRLGLLLLGIVVGGIVGIMWGRVRATEVVSHDRSLLNQVSDDRQQSDAALKPVLQPALMEMPDCTRLEADRNQTEGDLHASRAFLNQVFDVISDTIFVKDEQYRFILVNQAVCDLVGVAQEAFLGRSDYDLFPQAQADHFRQKDHHVFQTGLEAVTEEPLTNQNGEIHWLLTKKTCFQNQQGQKFLVGSSRDITDRKQAETMLRDRETVLRDLYRTTSDRHLSFQAKLRQLLAVGCRYFQLENGMVSTVEATNCRAIAVQSPLPEWVEGFVYTLDQSFCGQVLTTDEPFTIQQISHSEWRNHPGHTIFCAETYIGTKIQVKNSVHAILCFTSHTPCPRLIQPADKEIINLMAQWIGGEIGRQQAETALQQLNQALEQRVQDRTHQLQLALSAAKMGTWEWDMLTNRQYWSAENYALWGFCTDSSGRVLNQAGVAISPFPTFALVLNQTHPDDRDRLLQAVQQTVTQDQSYEIEHRILWDDGSIHWRYSRGAYVFNEQSDPIKLVGISMDITDRKRIEQEMYRSRDLFAAAFQESADAIFLVDPLSLLVLNCNQRAIELFEANCKQDLVGIQGHTLHQAPFSDVTLEEARQQVNRQGFWSQEIEYRTLKGRNFWGSLASRQIQVAEQEMHLVRITDISDRKQAERYRKRQAEADQLLAAIAQTINQSVYLNEVLDICLEQIRQFLQCDRVLVCRFTANYDVVTELEAVSQPEFSLLGRTIEDPCFGAAWAERYRQGYTTVHHDTQTEAITPCYAEFLAQMQVRASLVVAILQADQIWGLLIVHQCQSPRQWQPSEVDLLKQLGLQIGTASQKASLYTQLENQLAQKEVLLKEVHHRVKNNLQIISAVLWLQSAAANNPVVSGALSDTRNRLQAMSLIHEFLYQSSDLGQINFHDYIQRLAKNILIACSTCPDQINLIFHLQPVIVNLETAISCGLLLNELITNAIKHGFPDRRCGEIRLSLEQAAQPEATARMAASLTTATLSHHSSQAASHYILTVQDNGVGMPKTLKLNKLQSLGLKMVYDLARQLDGSIEHEHQHGTLFRLTFPVLEYR